MNLEALILDFGGVISKTMFETHRQTEKILGLAPGSLRWRGPFDPDTDSLWQSMQRGEISERDYWRTRSHETGEMVGEQWDSVAAMLRRVRGNEPAHCIRESAATVIEKVKKAGKKLAILSNELDLFYGEEFRAKLPLLSKFDLICDATHTKILKPDPRAYLQCVEQLGTQPPKCLFVDDQLRNIKGAEAVGCRCLHFDVRKADQCHQEVLRMMVH